LQGPWIHPEIDNPEYSPDPELYKRDEICAIGFDLWQVKSGTIFDNVLITDDPELAKQVGEDVWRPTFVSNITLCNKKIHWYAIITGMKNSKCPCHLGD
jgi:hypothetical protein